MQYAYLVGNLFLLALWAVFFVSKKDLRKQMLVMSVLVGVISLFTLYFWWSIDWWHPETVTQTKIATEDFLIGFSSGGIISVLYEIIFRKKYHKDSSKKIYPGAKVILLTLFVLTGTLIWGFKLHTFFSSIISLFLIFLIMIYFRKDLLVNGLVTGIGMVAASLFFYYPIIFFYPNWVDVTYDPSLSGLRFTGIPIEELLFWLFSGFVWGPFYKYWRREYEESGLEI